MNEPRPFDPSKYVSKLSRRQRLADGSWKNVELDYMEIKWRLVWLRSEQPDANLATEILELSERLCVCKATIVLPSGGSATGVGSETPDDWKDFIEKAETKAIGRALAALGYGTQFAMEWDEARDDDGPKPVDAPATRRNGSTASSSPSTASAAPSRSSSPSSSKPSASSPDPTLPADWGAFYSRAWKDYQLQPAAVHTLFGMANSADALKKLADQNGWTAATCFRQLQQRVAEHTTPADAAERQFDPENDCPHCKRPDVLVKGYCPHCNLDVAPPPGAQQELGELPAPAAPKGELVGTARRGSIRDPGAH